MKTSKFLQLAITSIVIIILGGCKKESPPPITGMAVTKEVAVYYDIYTIGQNITDAVCTLNNINMTVAYSEAAAQSYSENITINGNVSYTYTVSVGSPFPTNYTHSGTLNSSAFIAGQLNMIEIVPDGNDFKLLLNGNNEEVGGGNGGGGGGGGGNGLYGIWKRIVQSSGDETDIAIGGITGEPSNRVYMCELNGSTAAGLYKGLLNGNTVVWDAQYGIPDFVLTLVGSSMQLTVPSCSSCITTTYVTGAWSGQCGSLSGGGGGGGGGNSLYGIWNRIVQSSGDETDIAIGGITGEPANRVYMCELNGSTAAGFYKGTLNGNTVVWDTQYGIPDFVLTLVGSSMELTVPACPSCLTTTYVTGTWSGQCGPL